MNHFIAGRIYICDAYVDKERKFFGWTASLLKDFLSLKGLEQTSRKSGLVTRAFGAFKCPDQVFAKTGYQQIKEE